MREKTINIYDIAKLSGVSIATVSRVINGSPKVSEKTKQKVMAVMEQESYTPNMFARGLGLDSAKTIGSSVQRSQMIIWQDLFPILRSICIIMDMDAF